MAEKKFKVGDRVRWRSNSKGAVTVKEGEIAEVVLAGWYPGNPSNVTCVVTFSGKPRSMVSYTVLVRQGNRLPRLYWPHAKQLEVANVR